MCILQAVDSLLTKDLSSSCRILILIPNSGFMKSIFDDVCYTWIPSFSFKRWSTIHQSWTSFSCCLESMMSCWTFLTIGSSITSLSFTTKCLYEIVSKIRNNIFQIQDFRNRMMITKLQVLDVDISVIL